MKPVRLPAAATLALPRWGLIGLCLLYILPGIMRRDPWKSDDAAGFGIMWTMAHGGLGDWLAPNIAGLSMPEQGPLAFWIGAILIKMFGWLTGDALAARLSTLVFFLIGAASVWRTSYVLGRRNEAQPLRLAFGGHPAPKDYGRTLADGALLIYVACLGLLLRSHETTPAALHVALVATCFYTAACLFDRPSRRAALQLGGALGLLVLAFGWTVPLMLALAMLVLAALRDRPLVLLQLTCTIPLALAITMAWLLALQVFAVDGPVLVATWLQVNASHLAWPTLSAAGFLGKTLAWGTWPAWPIAGWAVYAWRRQSTLHVTLPAAGILAVIALCLFSRHPVEEEMLSLVPPMAILAAFGLPTLKRSAINAVDWFSVMTLSAIAAFIWLGWIAKQTGWPVQLARNAFKLAPGFKPEFDPISFLVALAVTIGWGWLLHWRLSRHPSVLWRAVVLSSGGVILCWLLLMTLWLPWLNYNKSYALVASQISTQLPRQYDCVATVGVGPGQRASFAFLGPVRFARPEQSDCTFLLVQDDNVRKSGGARLKKIEGNLTLLWQGQRPADRKEWFRLFKRSRP